jgi:hypothetical protein
MKEDQYLISLSVRFLTLFNTGKEDEIPPKVASTLQILQDENVIEKVESYIF